MNELQAEYAAQYGPAITSRLPFITYWSFRVMVGAGTLMIVLAAATPCSSCWAICSTSSRRFLKLLPFAIALPYLANTSGWLLTEVGRFPWVVFGLVKLEDGVSPVSDAGDAADLADRLHPGLCRADRGDRLPAAQVRQSRASRHRQPPQPTTGCDSHHLPVCCSAQG